MKRVLHILPILLLAAAVACGERSDIFYSTSYPVARVEAEVTVKTPDPEPDPDPDETEDEGSGETNNGDEDGGGESDPDDGTDSGTDDESDPDDGTDSGTDDETDGETDPDGGTEKDTEQDAVKTDAPTRRHAAGVTATNTSVPDGAAEADSEEESETDRLIARLRTEVLAEAPVQAGGYYLLDFQYFNGGQLTVIPSADGSPVIGTFSKQPGETDMVFTFGDNSYSCNPTSYSADNGTRQTVFRIDLTEIYQERYPDANITKVIRYEYTTAIYR